MRNPFRLKKNLRWRFLPFYAALGLAVVFSRPSVAGFAAGSALVVAGGALRSWGAGHLVKNDRLTISGPYAFLRHPLYAGTLAIGTGFTTLIGGWMAWALFATFGLWFFLDYFPRKEAVEAARLRELYGASYERYRAAVPALYPRLRRYRPERDDGVAAGRWSGACYDGNNELGTVIALAAGISVFALRVALVG